MNVQTLRSEVQTIPTSDCYAAAVGWLTAPSTIELPTQVAGWDDTAWEAARWAIQVHGIGPLLHMKFHRSAAVSALDPLVHTYLQAQYQHSTARVARLLDELAEILAACERAELAVIPLKGSLLATAYYVEPGLRPMNDLDLLIQPQDEERMLRLLEGLGYRQTSRNWKHRTLARPDGDGEVVAWDGEHPNNPRAIDLHVHLGEQFLAITYDLNEAAWSGSDIGPFLGTTARMLQPATLLHHLLIHATVDAIARRLRMLHLYDIALVAHQVDAAGWASIVAGAQARHEERVVYPALHFAARYFPHIPADVLAALRPALPEALLHHLDEHQVDDFSFLNASPKTLQERLIWFRPGVEQTAAMRHALLRKPDEIVDLYPDLARRGLLPLAYLRHAVASLRRFGLDSLRLAGRRARPRFGLPRRDV